MTLRWLLAFLHLLALPIGFAAIGLRARALRAVTQGGRLRDVLNADTWWGLAALLWISTGLARYFMDVEKGAGYYNGNYLFHAKMGLLGVVLLLEIWPMTAFIGWRVRKGKKQPIDTSRAPTFATISRIQALLILLMVMIATGMARGIGIMS